MDKQSIIKKLESLKLNLSVHPENEPNSEFEDRITDLEEIINFLHKSKDVKNYEIDFEGNLLTQIRTTGTFEILRSVGGYGNAIQNPIIREINSI